MITISKAIAAINFSWRDHVKSHNFAGLKSATPDHYAALGLHRSCTDAQIRAAYRLLAKQLHPDINGGSTDAVQQTQALNAAHEILSDPARRREYDRELASRQKTAMRAARPQPNITKEVYLRLEEFLRGTRLEVRVNEPAATDGEECYELLIPPDTAPGTRFKLNRNSGGHVIVRVKARPDFRFKARGSDLRCDLKISFQRARQGGTESVRGATGNFLRIPIPARVARGEIIRVAGEGLPKPRGGRGDLLVRVIYTPDVQIRRRR
jgi:DnaJ-class molecular chaperone